MKLRGILIDPVAKSITEVECDEYPAWKDLIEVDLISAVQILEYPGGNRETLWVDDEGLLNEKKNKGPFFRIATHPQPLAGKGIVFGTSVSDGDTVSTKL